MLPLFETIYDDMRESLGTPVRLLRLLDEHPEIRVRIEEPGRVIAAERVLKWHEWGHHRDLMWPNRPAGVIRGWRYADGHYRSFEVHRPELANLGQCHITEQWTCDIQDVEGLSCSKSTLTDFTSLDDMVEANSREMIDEITEKKLQENLSHSEIRLLHQKDTTDHFARFLWDGRLFLMNSGGSHHFAAARYIAARLDRPVPLSGKLRTYAIKPEAVDTLRRDMDVFLISSESEISNKFFEAMESFEVTHYLHPISSRPYDRIMAVLLPKNEFRSARVSRELRKAGLFDLGQHLADLCARQFTLLTAR